jgi:SAM-dependent methyltransferase
MSICKGGYGSGVPERHVDVGSRTDGFVAHVASFRQLEVFDVRPITTEIPGVTFRQADMMDASSVSVWQNENGGYCDSLSCLHVLEHFGLGRYGDPIDPTGYKSGFANLARLLRPGGRFYLSTPIGQERVEFNANWVFDPRTILEQANTHGLQLDRLSVFNPRTGLRQIDTAEQEATLRALGSDHYNLGIFVFTRPMELVE